MKLVRGPLRSLALLMAVLPAGCGGGAALLHPAHVLAPGGVAAGAGVGGQIVVDERGGVTPSPEHRFLERAASSVAFAPGISPWLGARVGIAGHNEAGLTYTGRTLRLEGRHAFGGDAAIATSIGAAASAVLSRPGSAAPEAASAGRFEGTADETTAAGFGFDVPALIGWRSTASIVEVWAGARAGMERVTGNLPLLPAASSATADLTAIRWYGGGLLGFAVGIRPIWVAFELDVAYQHLSARASFPGAVGSPEHDDGTVTGVTVAPAGALIGKF
jgi:hypothetical protein